MRMAWNVDATPIPIMPSSECRWSAFIVVLSSSDVASNDELSIIEKHLKKIGLNLLINELNAASIMDNTHDVSEQRCTANPTRIAFSALPNITYSFETVHEIASARRSPLSKKKKNPHETILLVIITIATIAGFAPEYIVIVARINELKSFFWFYSLY